MSIGAIGIDPTRVTTNAEFATGVRVAVEDQTTGAGTREYIYVSFAPSVTVAAGNAVIINDVTGAAVVLTAALAAAGQAAGRRVGIAPAAVSSSTSTQYGWIQIYGRTSLMATAAQAVNTALTTTGVAGVLGAAGVAITGVVVTTVGAGTTPVNGTLNYPFIAV